MQKDICEKADETKDVMIPNKEVSNESTPTRIGVIGNGRKIVIMWDQVEKPAISKPLDTLNKGEEVEILQPCHCDNFSRFNNFCKVRTKTNKVGYVYSKYIELQ